MLGLGRLALLRHPDRLRQVREQPELVEAAVEELLPWLSIVNTGVSRIATEPVEISGQSFAPWWAARSGLKMGVWSPVDVVLPWSVGGRRSVGRGELRCWALPCCFEHAI
jgi:hypothetical protein